mmetsp:Transcript_50598/g.132764  ORF Transcript_50598/g.132764 Transcript_50598/m.132764 type:complete len:163 (-) Transcript_50598:66-554(-)
MGASNSTIENKQVGVGIVLMSLNGEKSRFVNKLRTGGSASESDMIEMWDELVTINGVSAEALSDKEISRLAHGPTGSEVLLGLRSCTAKKDGVREVSLVRAPRNEYADIERFLFGGIPFNLLSIMEDTRIDTSFSELPAGVAERLADATSCLQFGQRSFLVI